MQIRCNDGKSGHCYIVGQSVLHCLTEQKRADLNHGWRVEVETNKKVKCVFSRQITRRSVVFPWNLGRFIISRGRYLSVIKGYLMMYSSRRLITLWTFH